MDVQKAVHFPPIFVCIFLYSEFHQFKQCLRRNLSQNTSTNNDDRTLSASLMEQYNHSMVVLPMAFLNKKTPRWKSETWIHPTKEPFFTSWLTTENVYLPRQVYLSYFKVLAKVSALQMLPYNPTITVSRVLRLHILNVFHWIHVQQKSLEIGQYPFYSCFSPVFKNTFTAPFAFFVHQFF